jgi:PIN domain nuclease of toxin-antitoxin system
MRLLLDTHTLIWHYESSPALSRPAKEALNSPDSQLYVSAATVWEIAIKSSLGKLKLAAPAREIIGGYKKTGTVFLPITNAYVLATEDLPWHHRDPFDRILIAQAGYEHLTLVSRDGTFDRYEVNRLWQQGTPLSLIFPLAPSGCESSTVFRASFSHKFSIPLR